MFNWIASIAIKKGINRGVKVIVGALSGQGLLEVLKQFGITIQIDQTVLAGTLGGAVIGIYEVLRNYLKSKGSEVPQLP